MVKRLLFFISLLICLLAKAQSFPYFNASTGNENEFPVDKDTNIYMFHGDRLVKTDKNFNVIWANTYSGFNFTSLLLSKTGSIFFLSGSLYGKLKSNGALEWVKSLNTMTVVYSAWPPPYSGVQPAAQAVILDRNDNLIVSGTHVVTNGAAIYTNSFIFKSDTNGVLLKFKPFLLPHDPKLFKILNDSVGVLKFAYLGSGTSTTFDVMGLVRYSDVNDILLSTKITSTNPPAFFTHSDFYIVKSKYNNDVFVSFSNLGVSNFPYNGVFKLNENFDLKWGVGIPNSSFTVSKLKSCRVEEIIDGIFYPVYSSCTYCEPYTNGFVKIDTLGNSSSTLTTMLHNYYYNPGPPPGVWNLNKFSLRAVANNQFYFDATGYYFPKNPLVIQKINGTLAFGCSNNYSVTSTALNLQSYTVVNTSSIASIVSITAPSTVSVNVSNTGLVIDTNFCLITNYKEYELTNLQIVPNPSVSKIEIKSIQELKSVEVYDVSGKLISTHSNTKEINVSELVPGMYYLRMNLGGELVTKKFIKE